MQVLAQRMQADQRLQLGDQLVVAAEGQLRLDAGLEGGHLQLVDADQLGPGDPGGGGHVGQGGSAPQRQRLAQQVGGPHRVAARQRPPRLPVEVMEAVQVEPLRDHLAQRRHVVLQRLPDGRRRLLAPDGLDQLVGGHHLVGVQQQLGQQHAVLDAAEPQRPVVLARLEWAEK